MRERDGRSLPTILVRVDAGTAIHADEGSAWEVLHSRYKAHRINHSIAFSDDGACTNRPESYLSRLRRAEIGTHRHISGKHLHQYTNEMAWREDHRRQSNGRQYAMVIGAALAHPISREWKAYWQRSISA